jgi:uncharacterized protein (TIGR02145 family)
MRFQHKTYCSITGSFVYITMILILFYACEKIEPERVIKVRTESVTDIQYTSSIAQGTLVDIGEEGIDQYGHCWSVTEDPENTGEYTTLGSRQSTGNFISHLENLTPGTQYYVKAYAHKRLTIEYGELVSFTTPAGSLPTINTNVVTSVTMNSAICGGEVSSEGGYAVIARGICWNTTGNPTLENNSKGIGSGPGSFDTQLTGLTKRTTYYVKAYATNQQGTNFGSEAVFTTSDLPFVSTSEIGNVKPNSVTCTGVVNDAGLAEVTVRGFCWDFNPGPTINDAHSENGGGTGEFEETISELASATRFFIRAYATNINGTVYGEQLEVITSFVDTRDFKTYPVTLIGEQYWMAENLNYGNYIHSSESQTDNEIVEKFCFDDVEDNCGLYGGYYTWPEMMQYDSVQSVQGVCPSGWHLPSDEEWKTLEMTLGMSQESADEENWRGTSEGGKLKLQGTDIWQSPNEGATNESGFSALPGGYYDIITNNDFIESTISATFWTSTKVPETFNAYYRFLDYTHAQIFRSPGYQGNSAPVRCIKD